MAGPCESISPLSPIYWGIAQGCLQAAQVRCVPLACLSVMTYTLAA
uniref:Macaca fascicularis brain cDNA clone: QflA-10367, similar to human erythrocyte membrane protein band 4.1-like 1 (EPB41L1),transcript variant 2, mRNA, RefSeq: NM_177996.1 n=1 Tax=Macaca fascicularis TaxID=9541 RepID=I7GHS2_MACFA|nr:unnamed protein product [Macaca fascicularis]